MAIRAMAAAQLAARCDPANWKAHWNSGLAIMMMAPKIARSKQAVAAFERVLALGEALSPAELDDARTALDRAQSRLQKGRDDLPMPEGCAVC